ncbi:hypothetical protein [Laspinema palackyanum]
MIQSNFHAAKSWNAIARAERSHFYFLGFLVFLSQDFISHCLLQ